MKPTDADMYPAAITAAQDALDLYEKHGRRTFLWQAYREVRAAAAAFPAFWEDLLLRLIDGFPEKADSLRKHQPEAVLRELTERVLMHMDGVAADLLKVNGTSSPAGAASLRKALRTNDQFNPTNAVAPTKRATTKTATKKKKRGATKRAAWRK